MSSGFYSLVGNIEAIDKDPDADLEYVQFWRDWLAGDTIVAASAATEDSHLEVVGGSVQVNQLATPVTFGRPPRTVTMPAHTGVVLRLRGGQVVPPDASEFGPIVRVSIETAAGRKDTRSFRVIIKER